MCLLKDCGRHAGRPRLRYKDNLKHNLKICKMNMKTWEADATNRPARRSECRVAVEEFEKNRTAAAKEKRAARKAGLPLPQRDVRVQQVRQDTSLPQRPPVTRKNKTCAPRRSSVVDDGRTNMVVGMRVASCSQRYG